MAKTLHETLGRRRFIASGVAAVGAVAATTGVASALVPSVAHAKAIDEAWSEAAPVDARYGPEDPDQPAESLLGLSSGMALGPFVIERVAMRDGAARVEAKGQGTRFRVDILRRSRTPRALAETDEYSLYLCNNGSGNDQTDEASGVGVMTLARYLQVAKPEAPADLLSYDQRRSDFGPRDFRKSRGR